MPVIDLTSVQAAFRGNTPITAIFRGGTQIWSAGRVRIATTRSLGFSGHSFLATAVGPAHGGDLHAAWPGGTDMNFMGFSSLRDRWQANGVDRTADYDGALLVTELGDLTTGLADPASAQGIETLQHLYWFALTAQQKGCGLFGIYPPRTPESGTAADDDGTMAKCQYWVDWLRALRSPSRYTCCRCRSSCGR